MYRIELHKKYTMYTIVGDNLKLTKIDTNRLGGLNSKAL
jgi:hypothetical protein